MNPQIVEGLALREQAETEVDDVIRSNLEMVERLADTGNPIGELEKLVVRLILNMALADFHAGDEGK